MARSRIRKIGPELRRPKRKPECAPDFLGSGIERYCGARLYALGLDRGYSAHSMRATFITTALENGAQLEDV
jgi:hypothetical protein